MTNTAPVFISQFSDQIVLEGDTLAYQFPSSFDLESNPILPTVQIHSMGTLPSFAQVNNTNGIVVMTFNPQNDLEVGSYLFDVTITDT